jgi:hypothetical protein
VIKIGEKDIVAEVSIKKNVFTFHQLMVEGDMREFQEGSRKFISILGEKEEDIVAIKIIKDKNENICSVQWINKEKGDFYFYQTKKVFIKCK